MTLIVNSERSLNMRNRELIMRPDFRWVGFNIALLLICGLLITTPAFAASEDAMLPPGELTVDTDCAVIDEAESQAENSDSIDIATVIAIQIPAETTESPNNAASSAEATPTESEENATQEGDTANLLVRIQDGNAYREVSQSILGMAGVTGVVSRDHVSDGEIIQFGSDDSAQSEDLMNEIRKINGVVSVQPNFVYKMSDVVPFTTVDDYWSTGQWALDDAKAYDAWDCVKTSGSVAVAVVDTGADLDHPDLAPNIVATHNTLSSTYTVEDAVGHGTHVAGIVSGVANNVIGVAGISYNADLVIIKASSYRGTEFDSLNLIRAYEWLESLDESGMTVAKHYNVRVVNLSIGGFDSTRVANMPDDELHKAILKARDVYGILTVVAAGNGRPKDVPYPSYPGDSYACFEVMNVEQTFNDETGEYVGVDLHNTSNYNTRGDDSKDICAPGSYIYSTYLDGQYASDTGTSMATPFVAGVAALVFAANPYLTPTQVQSIIEVSATDLGEPGWDERYGYGMVNAAAAVRMANVARMEGCKVVGVYGTTKLIGKLGPGQGSAAGAWKWDVYDDTGSARFTRAGVLLGDTEGDVIVRGTCTTSTGAEISVIDKIAVLNPEVLGDDVVRTGSSASYTCDDPRWTWVWKVENGTGEASIDWTGKLAATKAGTVEVTATCSSNTDIVVRKQVTIAAAAAAAPMRAASCAPMLALLPAGTFTLDDTIAA